MKKTSNKTSNKKQQTVSSAVNELEFPEVAFREEDLADLITAIYYSTLEPQDRVYYVLSLLRGTLSFQSFKDLQKKMKNRLQEHEQSVSELEKEVKEMKKELKSLGDQVVKAAPKAMKDCQHIREVVFDRTKDEIERRKKTKDTEKIEEIKKKIKKQK